nr:centrobin isoform X7 [Zootoca vivipara]XP_034992216.1 centrobin isoform X7 [Zootoca vivipara]
MDDKSACRTLSSSIHSEDLLSDMELLPPSAPATPGQKVPSSQAGTPYTSQVTAQLYASLHQSRQAEAQARSHLENQHSLGHSREAEAPEVDLDTLAEELSHRLSTSVEASTYRKGPAVESRHISEMENVRCHLQGMLRGSRDAAHGEKAAYDLQTTIPPFLPAGDAVALRTFEQKDDDSFESDTTTALLNARPLQEVSPPGSLAGFEQLFPRYTSLRLGQVREHPPYANSHLLKDSLDKEQARRKHCERHIQALQNRILELQQQLAVAVSADKKKDSMIEQLDKTLAKVVEGWNRHEAERTATLRRLQTEKEGLEQALGKQKEKISEVEERLEQALSALSQQQQAANQFCKEKEALEEERARLSCDLEAERRQVHSLEAEWNLERRQQETLRATLEEQQKAWAQRERQLDQQQQVLQEESRSQLDKEKAVAQREAQKAADAQRVLASVQSEVQGLEAELEAMRRERDNLKMEISLVKARYEAQKVKLESELKVALEQRVTERMAEVHEESLRQMSSMREQHRKQLLELSGHHEKELASQLAQFKADLAEREERQRHFAEDYECRISKQQDEIRELQAKSRRLEMQRAEMMSQFQAMMKAHWNEALRLFTSGSPASPQPKAQQQQQQQQQDTPSDLELLQPSESLTKTQKAESLGSSQGAGDCEGSAWAQAVPLQPAAQRSSSRGLPDAPDKSLQDAYRHLLPLLPDMGRLSSEFSHVFNHSLLSQPGFQQLEPQVDSSVAGLPFHPDNLAEHPFTDDTDETMTEAAGNEGETLQQSSLEGGAQVPQPDLNYYLRLILDRSAYETAGQKQERVSTDSPPPAANQTQFGTSLSYHERSTALWDPAQPSASTIHIQQPSNTAVHKTKVPLLKAHEGGILSPKQVAEVSRLLRYHQAKGRTVPSPEDLYKYLREIGQNGCQRRCKSASTPEPQPQVD